MLIFFSHKAKSEKDIWSQGRIQDFAWGLRCFWRAVFKNKNQHKTAISCNFMKENLTARQSYRNPASLVLIFFSHKAKSEKDIWSQGRIQDFAWGSRNTKRGVYNAGFLTGSQQILVYIVNVCCTLVSLGFNRIGGHSLPGAGVGFIASKPRKGSLKWSQRWG